MGSETNRDRNTEEAFSEYWAHFLWACGARPGGASVGPSLCFPGPLSTPPAPPGAKNGLACLRTPGPLVCTVLPVGALQGLQPEGPSCSLSWGNPVTGRWGAESPAGLTLRWGLGGGLCCLPLGTEAARALPLWPSPHRRVRAGPRGRPTASAEEPGLGSGRSPPPSSSEPREARRLCLPPGTRQSGAGRDPEGHEPSTKPVLWRSPSPAAHCFPPRPRGCQRPVATERTGRKNFPSKRQQRVSSGMTKSSLGGNYICRPNINVY